ncbi:Equilibrative nucleotide transporter 3, partial [Camellia lanceoleosa]
MLKHKSLPSTPTSYCWKAGQQSSIFTVETFLKYHPPRVLTLGYQSFSLGTLAILTYKEAKINAKRRNLFGYIPFFLSALTVLVVGGIGTYITISGAFRVADAHVQGGMVGDLSFMLSEFMQLSCFLFFMSFLAGLAASGALTAGLRLITKAAFENSKDCLCKGASTKYDSLSIATYWEKLLKLSTKELLFQNIDYALDMFLIYALTLSIFPRFQYEDTGSHSLGSCAESGTHTMYIVCDLIGRYVSLLKCIKLESQKGTYNSNCFLHLAHPSILFHSQIWRPGLDDIALIILG